jgi:hypothetical protein
MDPLSLPPLDEITDHERMIRLVESSPDIQTLAQLVHRTPTELPILLRRLEAQLKPPRPDSGT